MSKYAAKSDPPPAAAHPFNDLSLANVVDCYRCSPKYRATAAAYWLAGRATGAVVGMRLSTTRDREAPSAR